PRVVEPVPGCFGAHIHMGAELRGTVNEGTGAAEPGLAGPHRRFCHALPMPPVTIVGGSGPMALMTAPTPPHPMPRLAAVAGVGVNGLRHGRHLSAVTGMGVLGHTHVPIGKDRVRV